MAFRPVAWTEGCFPTNSDRETFDGAGYTNQHAAREQQRGRFAGSIRHLDRGGSDARRDGPAAERQRGRCSQEDEYRNQNYLHFLTRCPHWQTRCALAAAWVMHPEDDCNVTSTHHPSRIRLTG